MNESKKQQKKAKVGKDSQASAVSKVKPAKKKSSLVKESAKDSKTDEASLDSVSLFLFLFCLFIYLLISFWYHIVCFINWIKEVSLRHQLNFSRKTP